MKDLTDLELMDKFCEVCIEFINPQLFNEITKRGLYNIVNKLPRNLEERKATVRARWKANGNYIGDEEIQQIASEIKYISDLKTRLSSIPASEVVEIMALIQQMLPHLEFVRDYYKEKPLIATLKNNK